MSNTCTLSIQDQIQMRTDNGLANIALLSTDDAFTILTTGPSTRLLGSIVDNLAALDTAAEQVSLRSMRTGP